MIHARRTTTLTTASTTRTGLAVLAVAAALAFGQSSSAGAATFSVNPTRVFLSAAIRSSLVSLKNETDRPVRFQLSVVSWSQDPIGQMQTAPTDDIVCFPTLLALQPREERKVRVGVTTTPGNVEKTYRLFVEELPPLDKAETAGAVSMLTKLGIPVFLQPAKAVARGELQNLALEDGRLRFDLRNAGTVFFLPQSVRVRGLDASGSQVADVTVDAWYVLAGGVRSFDIGLPTATCGRLRALEVNVQVASAALKETLQTPGGACAR
jgi:fimbrial chaperone protein